MWLMPTFMQGLYFLKQKFVVESEGLKKFEEMQYKHNSSTWKK